MSSVFNAEIEKMYTEASAKMAKLQARMSSKLTIPNVYWKHTYSSHRYGEGG